jgi:hypothetical protein
LEEGVAHVRVVGLLASLFAHALGLTLSSAGRNALTSGVIASIQLCWGRRRCGR